jgi:hypothetical protein
MSPPPCQPSWRPQKVLVFFIMLIRKGAFCAKCAGLDQNGSISSRIANTVSGLPDFIYIRLLKLSLQSQV